MCVFSLSLSLPLSPSLSFAACLLATGQEVLITHHATVFSMDVLQDVIIHGNPFASPITWCAHVVFCVVFKMTWFSMFRVLWGNVHLQRLLWSKVLQAMRTRELFIIVFLFHVGYGCVAPCPEHFAKPNVLPYSVFPVYVLVPFAARHDHHEVPCVVLMEGSPPAPEFPTHLQ